MPEPLAIPAHAARTLLLDAQGLLASPRRKASEQVLNELIRQLGFVQIDSINVVERAHHLTLGSRLDHYRPELLKQLLEHDRRLFEHWTHDASVIPIEFYPHWKPRFARHVTSAKRQAWWKTRLGPNPQKTIKHVRQRIEREGPLQSRDFEHDAKAEAWWGWKPQKVALEHLWRCGELAIARRVNFQKVYDLSERVFPDVHALPEPHTDQYIDWACGSALQRLVIASPVEIAAYWHSVTLSEARTWCKRQIAVDEVVPVQVGSKDDCKAVPSVALPDWQVRLDAASSAPKRTRLLSPFDPVIRDRKRLLRLFAFDYRFEAFVPQPKRVFGYYVMPILENDRLIGRLDPKFNRDRGGGGELAIRRIYLESGVKMTASRREGIEQAVARLARLIGADRWTIAKA